MCARTLAVSLPQAQGTDPKEQPVVETPRGAQVLLHRVPCVAGTEGEACVLAVERPHAYGAHPGRLSLLPLLGLVLPGSVRHAKHAMYAVHVHALPLASQGPMRPCRAFNAALSGVHCCNTGLPLSSAVARHLHSSHSLIFNYRPALEAGSASPLANQQTVCITASAALRAATHPACALPHTARRRGAQHTPLRRRGKAWKAWNAVALGGAQHCARSLFSGGLLTHRLAEAEAAEPLALEVAAARAHPEPSPEAGLRHPCSRSAVTQGGGEAQGRPAPQQPAQGAREGQGPA